MITFRPTSDLLMRYENAVRWFISLFTLICLGSPARALQPDQILVIANRNAARSTGLAKYYMEKREIPETNLLNLWLTDKEVCTREDYDRKVAPVVRERLKELTETRSIRCLVTVYGLPLKILPPGLTEKEADRMKGLRVQQAALKAKLKLAEETDPKSDETKAIRRDLKALGKKISTLSKTDRRASFDSELALVLHDEYPLSGWRRNPHFIPIREKTTEADKKSILFVSRLDGPTDAEVERIIDESIEMEKKGLQGVAYFDARWPRKTENKKLSGYAAYDNSIHKAADRVRDSGRLPVVVDDRGELFGPGDCPNAALYCGWYSLSRYVDAFEWRKGAVGYHIASGECATLKHKNSRAWCKKMPENGVAATVGPVWEPYVQAFPIPELFFGLLVESPFTLAECYFLSTPYLSWQMALIGDPLYRPFKNTGKTP